MHRIAEVLNGLDFTSSNSVADYFLVTLIFGNDSKNECSLIKKITTKIEKVRTNYVRDRSQLSYIKNKTFKNIKLQASNFKILSICIT